MAISCRVDLSQILTHTHKSNLATCIKPNYLNKNLNVTGKKKKKKGILTDAASGLNKLWQLSPVVVLSDTSHGLGLCHDSDETQSWSRSNLWGSSVLYFSLLGPTKLNSVDFPSIFCLLLAEAYIPKETFSTVSLKNHQ